MIPGCKILMNRTWYIMLFLLFVILYFLIYGSYGFNDADDGYVLALSWRVVNGEIPYRDFYLIRPPLSVLLHSMSLYLIPPNYQIIFERFLSYLLIALSSLFCSFAIDRAFDLKSLHLNKYLLATVGFVFSVHNFSPMPWYTVDGIFFASSGILILIRHTSKVSIAIGSLFLFASALCKQPFYLMPVAGIFLVFKMTRQWSKTLVYTISLSLNIILFLTVLAKFDALSDFLEMTSGSTKIRDLISAGFLSYVRVDSIYLILPLFFWLISKKFGKHFIYEKSQELVPYFLISILLLYPLLRFIISFYIRNPEYNPEYSDFFRDETARILFLLTVAYIIEVFEIERRYILLSFLTLLSWCAGISWGLATPVLFSAPLIFVFFLFSKRYFHIENMSRLAVFTLILGTITYFTAYQKPYCNPARKELKYELSDIFPKFGCIKAGPLTYEKYAEFKDLVEEYGTNFKTLPGMPLSNFLTNTKSPIALDWVSNGETNNKNSGIINELMSKGTVIFVEREPQLTTVTTSVDKFNSSVTYYIASHWNKVDSTKHFLVYKLH